MGQLSACLRGGDGRLTYWCQGCEEPHSVRIREDGQHVSPAWGYNGNPDRPTFTPSVLVTSGHYVAGQEGKRCWCDYNREHPEEYEKGFECSVCHTFIVDGMVQFLADCTHQFAGQTLPLPELPEHMRDGAAP